MRQSILGGLKNSVARKIFTVVFPAYLAGSVIITVLLLAFQYYSIRLNLKSQLVNIQTLVKPGLIQALKKHDVYQVDHLLKIVQQHEAVVGVQLDTPLSNTPFLTTGLVKPDQISGLMVHSIDLSDRSSSGTIYVLGTLTIYSGNVAIIKTGLLSFIMIMIGAIILVVLLWGLFLWGGHHYLSGPLARLIQTIQKISSGELTPAQARIVQEKQEGTDLDVLVMSFNTMMERLTRSTQDLFAARNRLDGIIRAMPSALIGMTQMGVITDWNLEAEKISGVKAASAIGQPIVKVFEKIKPYLDKIDLALQEQTIQEDRKIKQLLGEEEHFYDLMIYPVVNEQYSGAVIRIDDITAQVQLEEVMIQTEKLSSVGGLAAGVAHEINNPLGAIIQGTQNILRRVDLNLPGNLKAAETIGIDLTKMEEYLKNRKVFEFIEGIRKSGERAADIVSNLLQFSRRSSMERTQISFEEIIDRALELARTDYNLKKKTDFKAIEIVREYADAIPPIVCSITEVEQVILNLLKNAAYAMQANTNSPKITLRLQSVKQGVQLELEDNGSGMPEKVRKRIFEPFFTTKPVGEGTGLGLSVSYNLIVKNNHGSLQVDSLEGRGTKFTLVLPTE